MPVKQSEGNADDSIYLWDGYQVRMFLSYCLDSHVSLGNKIPVDADLCSTSSSHIKLAGAFYGYPIRLVKPSDIDLILPLKLNCALFVHEYSICQCATFKRESWQFNELLWCNNYQGIGCVPLFLILPPAWQSFQQEGTVNLKSVLTCQKPIRMNAVNHVERLRSHYQGLAPNYGQYQWIRCKRCLPLHSKYLRLQCWHFEHLKASGHWMLKWILWHYPSKASGIGGLECARGSCAKVLTSM